MTSALLVPALGSPPTAEAQGYAGNWRGGPARMQVTVESWGPDCGQRPQSNTGPAQGSVRVSEDGDHLVIHGTPQRRTDACWSDNPTVRRVSSSHREGTWRVVCRTRPQDPRAETGTYSLTASDDNRLSYREVSNYDWQLNESRCTARITVTQAFTRTGAAPTPTKATPDPPPERPTCTPGSPATVRLRPREAQVEPGAAVRFTARVVDASGCPVPGQRIRWELTRPSAAMGELEGGLFTAAENAAEAEGEFRVKASAGRMSARATVVVRTADLSDLIARRAAVGVTQTADTDFELTAESSAGVSARADEEEDDEGSILPLLIGAALVLALLLAVAVAIVARRGRKKPTLPRETLDPGLLDGVDDFGGPEDPPGDLEAGPGGAAGGAAGAPGAPAAGVTAPTLPMGQALICPSCRRGFGAETKSCPSDGTDLVPYSVFVERHQASEKTAGGRICPTCGERFGRNTVFCGKDGTPLEEVN